MYLCPTLHVPAPMNLAKNGPISTGVTIMFRDLYSGRVAPHFSATLT